MKLIRTNTPAIDAGRQLSNLLLANTNTPLLLLVSGGTAVSVIEHCDTTLMGDHITLGLVDERFSKDPAVLNSAVIETSEFLTDGVKYGAHVLDIAIEDKESSDAVADRWEDQLRTWINWYPKGKIFAVLGIGADGHTAGIMPNIHDVDFFGSRLAMAYTMSKEIDVHTERITVTFTFLKTYVDEAIVYAVGPQKQKAIDTMLADDAEPVTLPAAIFKEMKSVQFFTDK
jgi:6-phosphogluconolactonase/glucosamine-6-phosphate isomerase/deaminase